MGGRRGRQRDSKCHRDCCHRSTNAAPDGWSCTLVVTRIHNATLSMDKEAFDSLHERSKESLLVISGAGRERVTLDSRTCSRIFIANGLLCGRSRIETATRYRSSVLGWAWSLLQPLATLLVYAAVFSLVFRIRHHRSARPRTHQLRCFLHRNGHLQPVFRVVDVVYDATVQGELLRKVHFPRGPRSWRQRRPARAGRPGVGSAGGYVPVAGTSASRGCWLFPY